MEAASVAGTTRLDKFLVPRVNSCHTMMNGWKQMSWFVR